VIYSYVKFKQKVKSSIGPLEKDNGSFTTDDKDAAETLKKFFESILLLEKICLISQFLLLELMKAYIELILLWPPCLNSCVNLRSDDLHSYVLKACVSTICIPCCYLVENFQISGSRLTLFLCSRKVVNTKLRTTDQLA